MATDPTWMKDHPTPSCVFCGEATIPFVLNEGGVYSCAVSCSCCDSHGPIVLGTVVEDVVTRAIERYERATTIRDRLLEACKAMLVAGGDDGLRCAALAMMNDAVRAFTLAGERRMT